jgi:tRNA dimethylallyltransferase
MIRVITGPTASGKSRAAISLAHQDPSIEIVNADSQLIYRGFDIGTAKPSKPDRELVPHHLIDILDPHERFSAAQYSKLARETIRGIVGRGKTPLIVGGTGFYIDALFKGLIEDSASKEELTEATKRYRAELEVEGFGKMIERLQTIDPDLYVQVSREQNPLRLERAWTYYYANGIALGEARKAEPEAFELDPAYEVLDLPKGELWQRIEQRVRDMIDQGWTREVERLLANGVTTEMPAMKAIGYREIAAVVVGVMKQSVAHEQIVIRTRQYAKRQLTWIRKAMKQVE